MTVLTRLCKYARWNCTLFLLVASLVMGGFVTELSAQTNGKVYLSEGGVVGELAAGYRMRQKDRSFLQPMKFLLPEGVHVAVAAPSGYVENSNAPGIFSLRPGDVYRFKLYNIPFHEGAELFPTVEVLNRTFPPKGKELEFPVELLLTQEDLELACDGKFVMRVVYLEKVTDAYPIDSTASDDNLTIETPPGLSPLAIAETRGSVMAIVRIGSRLPEDEPNAQNPFYYGLPPFALPIPAVSVVNAASK